MGMLDKLFGRGEHYPPLPRDAEAMARLDGIHGELEALTRKVHDRLEIVPAENEAFIFLGKPPKRFGIAWIHDGNLSSLQEMIEENHLSSTAVEQLLEELRQAYTHASDAPRYTTHVGDAEVIVTPSAGLEHEVHEILEQKLH